MVAQRLLPTINEIRMHGFILKCCNIKFYFISLVVYELN
jgi:hypothetical protein